VNRTDRFDGRRAKLAREVRPRNVQGTHRRLDLIVPRSASRIAVALAALLIGVSGIARAHHSQLPFFPMDRNVTVHGTVAKFDFVNPHPIIFLDVTDGSGTTVQWQIEGPTTIYLQRAGWSAGSLLPGDEIVVRGAPPKVADARIIAGREVRKTDGTVLKLYAEDARRVLDLGQ
jgi:hypothetical protein